MSFPTYEEYTPNGIEWLPEVPSNWQAGRLRWQAKIYSGGTPDKTNEDYWTDGTIPWLNSGAVNQQLITEPSTYITQDALEKSSAKWVPENALVIALAGQGKTKGMVAQLAFRTTCNQSMAAIIPNGNLEARFLFWWLTSNYQNIRNLSGGDLRDGLNLQLLGTIGCPIPNQDEQRAISSFLDVETSKIDGLVSEQRRLIDLLKEKRQAVISHAVTKGLNPNAPMKPSGIQWLGDVPQHWNVGSVRRVINAIEQGWSPQCDSRPAEANEWGILKTGCVNRGVFSEIENKALPHDLEPIAEYEVKSGDVLMSRASGSPDLVGATAFVFEVRPKLMLSDKTFRIHLAESMEPMFFVSVFNSQLMRAQIEQSISGAEGLANNLPQAKLKCFSIALPPRNEQVEIVKELALRCKHFDTLQAESERAIELLKERRTALISAAVTGKIDVREFTPVSGEALAAGSSTVVPKVSGKALAAGSSERLTSKVLKS
jgi:type I restriction enzyme S subunit